jgi:nitroreductase
MDINNIIRDRRAIYPKEFTGESIGDKIVSGLLENAHWAPSHGNIFPWQFKVFKGESMKELTNKMAELYEKFTPAEKFRKEKPDKLRKNSDLCSHIIAICFKPSDKYPETEELCAVACAVQNFWLSLSQFEDIGGYWTTGSGTFTPEMDEYLELKGKDKCIGFFLLGKVDSKRIKGHRPPMGDRVEWKE